VRSIHTSAASSDAIHRSATRWSFLHARWFYAVLVLVGLAIRVAFVPLMGTHDVDTILGWGRDVTDVGLADAYRGIYFPLEWQLSAGAVLTSRQFDISDVATLKSITLLFEVGTLVLLTLLLRSWRLDRRYALIYWLHPYFVLLFCLGYVDPHLGFSIIACLLILDRWPGPRGFLAAGAPLALATLMKPQAIGLVGVIPLLVIAALLVNPDHRRENLRPLLLLVAPLVLFAAYSLYFDLAGAGLNTIANTYHPSELARQSESLTAQMTNIWYPVALILRDGDVPVYTVTEPDALNSISQLAAILALTAAVTVLVRARSVIGSREVLFAFLFAALILPMIATHAHENHLYLGLLLSIPAAAAGRPGGTVIWPLQGLLAAQFLNIFAVQLLGLNELSRGALLSGLPDLYLHSDVLQLLLVTVTVVSWCWLAVEILRSAGATNADQEHLLGQRAYGQT
jgi:hypothetical protein